MTINEDWYVERFENYRTKLKLSKVKARKRLMIIKPQNLHREYDRICDNKFWSNKEPGVSHTERKQREKNMYKQVVPQPIQLKLF